MNELFGHLTKIQAAALASCVFASCDASAQVDTDERERFSFEPELLAELRYDDNIFRSFSAVTSSWISMISPAVYLMARPSAHRFELKYRGDFAWYRDSEDDDYNDHFMEAGAYFRIGRRSSFDLIGSYDLAHENRGTGLTEGFDPALNSPPEPDEYGLASISGIFGLGDEDSIGRLVIEAVTSDLEYKNNEERTRFYDRVDTYGNATFYYRVLPGTSLLAEVRAADIDWQNDRPLTPSLDNNEYRYFLGVTWDSPGAITGTLKGGYVKKKFNDAARGEYTDPSWDASVRWSPVSYSHLELRTARLPSETNGFSSFVENTIYSINWAHEWTKRVKTELEVSDWRQVYRDSAINRQQELTQYSFSLSYKMRPWISWKIGAELSSRDSNTNQFQFDGNVYRLSVLLKR